MKPSGPGSSRRRLPAEWEPHDATWLVWPQNEDDWPGKLGGVRRTFCEIAKHLSTSEKVRIIVGSEETKKRAENALGAAGADTACVEFFGFPTDRSWIRDSGPFFVRDEKGALSALDFGFNGWARYPDWKKDDEVGSLVARSQDLDCRSPARGGERIVLEGGSVDSNGRGSLLTTRQCLLDEEKQTRNPLLTKRDYEEIFSECLGADNTLWLGRGIEGDDTNGHVDDVCRFAGPATVVLCRESDPDDANYLPLRENMETLEDMRLENGERIEIIPLPMPSPLFFDGERLPATYANFYVSNEKVLVPTYGDPKDGEALGILSELFPGRKTVGISCVDLAWGFGAIHCMTKEQPIR